MNQRINHERKPRLDFCWGSGNDFLLWKRHSKYAPKVSLPDEIQRQNILGRFISINWEECDDRESKTILAFAQNLYQFHLHKFEIQNTIEDERLQQTNLLIKIKEANFTYCNSLARASEGYQKDGQEGKAMEYLQYFLIWKLADIFYMRESNASKTQEYANWIKFFPDVIQTKKSMEENTQCDWDSLYFYLSLGDIDNAILILKNIKFENQGDNIGFAIHETIEVLKKKIKYYKGDDCIFNDKQSFSDLSNKERDRLNNILLKWKPLLDENHEFLTFLKVLTGDLQTIEEVSFGDWKRFLNLIFLFYYPFVEKTVLETIINDFTKKYDLFDADKIFLSIIINPRGFTFMESILGQLPAWFTFHLSDMLYLFKQIPMEPLVFNEDDVDSPEVTFLDIVIQEMLGYILQARAPFDVIKYYVYYIFQNFSEDTEGKLSNEYMGFIEQIFLQRMDSSRDEDIQRYLQELHDPIMAEIEPLSSDLFSNLRSSLLKRMARNYTNVVNLNQYNITQALNIIANLGDPIFADAFGSVLIKEFEERGNGAVPLTLFNLELEGSTIFQISENLNFLLKYCKFKKAIQEIENISTAASDAKLFLIDMILDKNSPDNMRLLVLNYSIDVFENDNVKFTSEQIHAFIDQLVSVENYIKYEVEAKDQAYYKKIIHSIKLCLMRRLSKSILNE